ncbi:hypothetical protein [Methanobacterium alkalithermotolerans]|nr:hypothetical protein [Methanobacterium alkalithermotolerans]
MINLIKIVDCPHCGFRGYSEIYQSFHELYWECMDCGKRVFYD